MLRSSAPPPPRSACIFASSPLANASSLIASMYSSEVRASRAAGVVELASEALNFSASMCLTMWSALMARAFCLTKSHRAVPQPVESFGNVFVGDDAIAHRSSYWCNPLQDFQTGGQSNGHYSRTFFGFVDAQQLFNALRLACPQQ